MKLHEVYEGIEKFYTTVKANNDGSLRANVCLEIANDILARSAQYRWFELGSFTKVELDEFGKASHEVEWVCDPSLQLPYSSTVFTFLISDARVAFANPNSSITHYHEGLEIALFCNQKGENIEVYAATADKTSGRFNVGANTIVLSKERGEDGLSRWKANASLKAINDEYKTDAPFLNYLDGEMMKMCRMFVDYTLNLLTCKNIYIEKTPPIAALNKKRLKKGLFPVQTKHCIKVQGSEDVVFRYDGDKGSHKSPCIHLRRGHIRRLASGETTWVRACVVGKQGEIMKKHYEVKTA